MVKYINEVVFNTINELVNNGDTQTLERWLIECNEEISRREAQKESIFPLQYEKMYIESLLVKV